MEPVAKDYRISGNQVYLRPITAADTDMVLGWRNSDNVRENFIYRKPITKQEHLDWLHNKVEIGLVHQFVVCSLADDKPQGCVYLQHFEEENNKAESGIFLGDSMARGKGIGTEAVRLFVRYGFEQLGLHKIIARVLAYNEPSLRLHIRAGYEQEAYFREDVRINGNYEDVVLFGIIHRNREL